MAKNTAVFRKVSLDRLASPEQLDQLLQVTDARGWIALAAIGAVLITAIGWGVMGKLPENVGGMGILVKSGGVFEVVPATSGRVIDLAVAVGDSVTDGQVVARIAQPELSDRLQAAKATFATSARNGRRSPTSAAATCASAPIPRAAAQQPRADDCQRRANADLARLRRSRRRSAWSTKACSPSQRSSPRDSSTIKRASGFAKPTAS